MHAPTLVLALASVFICFSEISANEAEAGATHCTIYETMKCQGKPIKMNKEYEDSEKMCREQMTKEKKDNVKDRKRGKTCREVCKLQKAGVLDDKGTPQVGKFDKILESMLPADIVKAVKVNGTKCFQTHSSLKMDPKEISCKTYGPFLGCIWQAFESACDEDYDEIDWEM